MGWYFRKSKSAGPFRVNLSKSGVGLSAGVKGARISFGPRGTYVNLGRNGIYYRKKIGGGHKNYNRIGSGQNINNGFTNTSFSDAGYDMTNAIRVCDNPNSESVIGKDILSKTKKRYVAIIVLFYIAFYLIWFLKEWGVIASIGIGIILWILLSAKLVYDLDSEAEAEWSGFVKVVTSELARSNKIWLKENEQINIRGVKYGGAGYNISRGGAKISIIKPKKSNSLGFRTNVVSCKISSSKCSIYFFPSGIIVKKGSKKYSYSYDQISISDADVRFVESESLPHDAEIVGHTWKYVNKDGSPDRRFAENCQLPICRYGVLSLFGTFISLELNTSNNKVPSRISNAYSRYKLYYSRISNAKVEEPTQENDAPLGSDLKESDSMVSKMSKDTLEEWKNNVMQRQNNEVSKSGCVKNSPRSPVNHAESVKSNERPLTSEQLEILNGIKQTVQNLGKSGCGLLADELKCKVDFTDGQVYQGHAVMLYSADKKVDTLLDRIEYLLNSNLEYKHTIEIVSENEFIIHLYMDVYSQIDRELPLSAVLSSAFKRAQIWRENTNSMKRKDDKNGNYRKDGIINDYKSLITIDDPYSHLFDISDDLNKSDSDEKDTSVDDIMVYFEEE